jgi:hypothetical protein
MSDAIRDDGIWDDAWGIEQHIIAKPVKPYFFNFFCEVIAFLLL